MVAIISLVLLSKRYHPFPRRRWFLCFGNFAFSPGDGDIPRCSHRCRVSSYSCSLSRILFLAQIIPPRKLEWKRGYGNIFLG